MAAAKRTETELKGELQAALTQLDVMGSELVEARLAAEEAKAALARYLAQAPQVVEIEATPDSSLDPELVAQMQSEMQKLQDRLDEEIANRNRLDAQRAAGSSVASSSSFFFFLIFFLLLLLLRGNVAGGYVARRGVGGRRTARDGCARGRALDLAAGRVEAGSGRNDQADKPDAGRQAGPAGTLTSLLPSPSFKHSLLNPQGGNINAQDHNGWTLLHKAAISGDQPVVALLLERGASVNVADHR